MSIEPCPECAQGKHVNCTEFVPDLDGYLHECLCMVAGH